jgi:hypothetical protein
MVKAIGRYPLCLADGDLKLRSQRLEVIVDTVVEDDDAQKAFLDGSLMPKPVSRIPQRVKEGLLCQGPTCDTNPSAE